MGTDFSGQEAACEVVDGADPVTGGGAPSASPFVTWTASADLSADRVLAVTSDLSKDVSVAGALTLGLSTATRAELTAATSNIAALTTTVGGHTTTLASHT